MPHDVARSKHCAAVTLDSENLALLVISLVQEQTCWSCSMTIPVLVPDRGLPCQHLYCKVMQSSAPQSNAQHCAIRGTRPLLQSCKVMPNTLQSETQDRSFRAAKQRSAFCNQGHKIAPLLSAPGSFVVQVHTYKLVPTARVRAHNRQTANIHPQQAICQETC